MCGVHLLLLGSELMLESLRTDPIKPAGADVAPVESSKNRFCNEDRRMLRTAWITGRVLKQ
ncbi:hypothetical protein M758_UG315700 [Ceratodon purpureus]|nr:hypothetical protein M758_UG315700 [Ceratodon purpureus]